MHWSHEMDRAAANGCSSEPETLNPKPSLNPLAAKALNFWSAAKPWSLFKGLLGVKRSGVGSAPTMYRIPGFGGLIVILSMNGSRLWPWCRRFRAISLRTPKLRWFTRIAGFPENRDPNKVPQIRKLPDPKP